MVLNQVGLGDALIIEVAETKMDDGYRAAFYGCEVAST